MQYIETQIQTGKHYYLSDQSAPCREMCRIHQITWTRMHEGFIIFLFLHMKEIWKTSLSDEHECFPDIKKHVIQITMTQTKGFMRFISYTFVAVSHCEENNLLCVTGDLNVTDPSCVGFFFSLVVICTICTQTKSWDVHLIWNILKDIYPLQIGIYSI